MTNIAMTITTGRQSEWRRGGAMLLAAMIGYSFFTVPTVTLGLFMAPLQAEFGWTRTEISAGLTVFALVSFPLMPLMGMVVDRYGARRVALPGIVLSSVAFAAFGLSSGSIVQWFATWIVFALASLFTSLVVWSSAVSGAFGNSRGMALAFLLSGSALAQAIAPGTSSWLIETYGWRAGYGLLALVWGGLALVLAAFLFRDPGQPVIVSENVAAPNRQGGGGLTVRQALRSAAIYRVALATLLQTTLSTAALVHLVPLLTSVGLDRAEATSFALILAIAALAGKLVTGWLVDRVSAAVLPALCYGGPGLAFFLLLQGNGSTTLLALAIAIQGYSSGAALQLTTYLTTRYAGLRNFATIFGLMSVLVAVAAGLGPLIAGVAFDAHGDYRFFLLAGSLVGLLAGLVVLGLGRYPTFGLPRDVESG